MRVSSQQSPQPWRKTLHTLVCVCVVLSNLLSLLALTPQTVQAAGAPPPLEKQVDRPAAVAQPVAHAQAALPSAGSTPKG